MAQDPAGKLGGSLSFSTSSSGSTSTGSGQLVNRMIIDSNGLVTISGSAAMPSPTSTLTVSGSTILNTLSTSGNTVIGASSSQALTVNAAASFTAAVTAAAPLSILASNSFSALGDATLGTDPSNTLSVNARTVFAAPVTCNAAVSVTAGNAFSALGNTTVGSSLANSMVVNASATFLGPATFNQALQLYSNSATAANGVVLGFQRANNRGAVTSGFTLGSILFSGYDGSVQGPTAQIRSTLTVRQSQSELFCITLCLACNCTGQVPLPQPVDLPERCGTNCRLSAGLHVQTHAYALLLLWSFVFAQMGQETSSKCACVGLWHCSPLCSTCAGPSWQFGWQLDLQHQCNRQHFIL